MGSKIQAAQSAAAAKHMKEQGIRRRTSTCPCCYTTISIPTDNHRCRHRSYRPPVGVNKVGNHVKMPSLKQIVAVANYRNRRVWLFDGYVRERVA
jgi:hypothetical protein